MNHPSNPKLEWTALGIAIAICTFAFALEGFSLQFTGKSILENLQCLK